MSAVQAEARPHHHAAAGPARRRPEVPTLVVAAAAAVLVVNIVVMFLGAWRTGISWDEPIHVLRLQSYFTTEWYLPPSQMVGDQPAPGVEGLYVYAPVAALLTHVVAVVLGAEGAGESSAAGLAYAARHLGVALFAVLGLAAAGAIVRIIARSWRWGLLAAAVLSAIPTWTGHAMFNIKDLPVATGYTLVTLGLVALSREGVATSRRLRALGAGALGLGVVIAVGTRPGMWAGLVASVAAFLLLTWFFDRNELQPDVRRARRLSRLWSLALGTGGAYVVLLLVYPKLFGHPALLIDALRDSADYPWVTSVLMNGSQMAMPPSSSYLPLWLAAQTPILIGAAAVVGAIATMVLLVRAMRRRSSTSGVTTAVGLSLVLCQAITLPAAAVLRHSILYDAARQVLFVIPALAALAALGTWLIVRWMRSRGTRWMQPVVWTAVVVGLVAPTATHIRLFPYDYTYFNLAAEARPIDNAWMVDYWRLSGREVTPAIPPGTESCVEWRKDITIWPCSSLDPLKPHWNTRGSGTELAPAGAGEYWFTLFNRDGTRLPEGCTEVSRVARPLVTQAITMVVVGRCAAPLQDYPAGGIRTANKQAAGFLLWGWYPSQALGVWSGSPDAEVGFMLPSYLNGRPVRLTLTTAPYVPPGQTREMRIAVNGTLLRTLVYGDSAGAGSVVVDVPADVAGQLEGRFVVTLSVPSVIAPASVGDGKDVRPLGVVLGRVTLEAAS